MEEELGGLKGTDYKIFYGATIEGYLEIPDNRGVEFNKWYSEMFLETRKRKRKRAKVRGKRHKKKKTKRKKSKRKKSKRLKSKRKRK